MRIVSPTPQIILEELRAKSARDADKKQKIGFLIIESKRLFNNEGKKQ